MMPSPRKAQVAFIFALILLCISGIAAYLSIVQLRKSQRMVVHTLEVQAAFGAMDSALGKVGRARTAYVTTHDEKFLQIFQSGLPEIRAAVTRIHTLTKDNPLQRSPSERLQELADQRIVLFERSVALAQSDPQDIRGQNAIVRQNVPIAEETTILLAQMREEEQRLLRVRAEKVAYSFTAVEIVLVLGFIFALILLAIHYRLLTAELKARQRVEQIVRESEERLKLVLDSARMGAWDLDVARGKYVRTPRYDEIFGYDDPQQEWNTDILLQHVFPEDRDHVHSSFEEAYKTGNLLTECRIVWPDRSIHWIEIQGHVYMNETGKPVRMMGVVADVSERKRAEEEILVQNAQLRVVNKELEAFSYSVSHDLRSPLRAIDGFSLALMEDCEPKLTPEEKNYLHRIRAAANRMGHLIDDLLKLARTSRREMVREEVNLSELAEEIVSQFRLTEAENATRFVISPNLVVVGDRGLLRVALENLLDNARKFSSKQPHPVVEFGMQEDGEEKVYFVRDNGAGFDMRYSDKLFGTFHRLHEEQEYPGTGVGLASVHRVIQRHGGRIWAESTLDQGATFYFTLAPFAEEVSA